MSEIGLLNTGVPLMLMGLLALGLPYLLLSRDSRSHRDAALAVLAAALILLVVGAVGYAALAVARGFDLDAAMAASRWRLIELLFWRSAMSAIVWGPVLLLAWIGLSIRINRARGADMARRDP